MKKLTNVSPFLLLLVPVFMMMMLTMFSNAGTEGQNIVNTKATNQASIATLPAARFK